MKNKSILEIVVDNNDLQRWTDMANILCLSIPEYIRRCTNAHTTILEYDSFQLVPSEKEDENVNAGIAQ